MVARWGSVVLLTVASASAWAGAPAKAGRACMVDGKSVDPFVIDVTSKGGPALRVRVQGVAATVYLGETPGPARVEVRGALVFEGTVPVDKAPIKPKAALEATNGMLRLAAGAEGLDLHARGKWLDGEVALGGVRIKGLTFPCGGLTLDAVAGGGESQAEGKDVWVPKSPTVTLFHGPGQKPQMEVVAKDSSELELSVIERGGAWSRVRRRWPDGSSITGWIKTSDLSRPGASGERLSDLPIVSNCTRAPAAQGGAKLYQASVAAGTGVLADRLFQWATVRGGDTLTVRWQSGERFVELLTVPGVVGAGECPEHSTVLDEAWVPRASVKLPGDAAGPAAVPDLGAH